jgi:hypothetical protein
MIIQLAPQAYHIDEIDVAAESRVLQRILRTASERIPQNYFSGSMNIKFYVEKRESVDGNAGKSTRVIVDLYDAVGYSSPSWTDAFKNRNYRIAEVQMEDPKTAPSEAATNIDELLEMDVARLSNTILNRNLITDYKLKLEAKATYNNDSAWIISYQALKNDLAHTGSYYPTSFSGKVYIACQDYAILRNEIHLTESKSSNLGHSIATKASSRNRAQMNIVVGYKKNAGKYTLSFVNTEEQYTTSQRNLIYCTKKLVNMETSKSNPEVIKGRDYFAAVEPNSTFWSNFVIPSN